MWGFWQMRLLNNRIAAVLASLGLTLALSGCGLFSPDGDVGYQLPSAPVAPAAPKPVKVAKGELPPAAAPLSNGPASDYPITIGDPYSVGGVSYTPADVWNYDEVGYIAMDRSGGNTISGAHHTLPIPSYVEVTSLDTGKTILVRIERRGPMNGTQTIALSPGAIGQLGASPSTPVRVRRVNPQEPERAALRSGRAAPDRMETPMSLVNVLKLKLPGGAGSAPVSSVAVAPSNTGSNSGLALPPLDGAPPRVATAGPPPLPKQVVPKPAPKPVIAAAPVGAPGYVVQAGAFSTRDRADRVARAIGGKVTNSNGLYRVRVGPYGSRQAAEASLAKVKGAGYSEARIYSDG